MLSLAFRSTAVFVSVLKLFEFMKEPVDTIFLPLVEMAGFAAAALPGLRLLVEDEKQQNMVLNRLLFLEDLRPVLSGSLVDKLIVSVFALNGVAASSLSVSSLLGLLLLLFLSDSLIFKLVLIVASQLFSLTGLSGEGGCEAELLTSFVLLDVLDFCIAFLLCLLFVVVF